MNARRPLMRQLLLLRPRGSGAATRLGCRLAHMP
jgi:hypothetical protein